jgi:hypothetical protein
MPMPFYHDRYSGRKQLWRKYSDDTHITPLFAGSAVSTETVCVRLSVPLPVLLPSRPRDRDEYCFRPPVSGSPSRDEAHRRFFHIPARAVFGYIRTRFPIYPKNGEELRFYYDISQIYRACFSLHRTYIYEKGVAAQITPSFKR